MPANFNLRFVFWALLALALVTNVQLWQHDYPGAAPVTAAANSAPAAALGSAPPVVSAPTAAPTPGNGAPNAATAAATTATATTTTTTGAASTSSVPATPASAAAGAGPIVHVMTDVLDMDIGLAGGEIRRVDLLAYPKVKAHPEDPVRFMTSTPPDAFFVLQGGLAGPPNQSAPTHLAMFTSPLAQLNLAKGESTLVLPLTWTDGHGVTVTKTFTFHRGNYQVAVDYHVENGSAAAWSFAPYAQLVRTNTQPEHSYFDPSTYAFKGPAWYDGTRFAEIDITKPVTLDQTVRNGYAAAMQLHFVAAIVPPTDTDYRYSIETRGNQYDLKVQGPTTAVAAGGNAVAHQTLFIGPKLQDLLDQTHSKLDLVTDYGHLSIIAIPLFWLLDHTNDLVHNWGVAIIIVTIILKLLFYPLAEMSGKSMARMKSIAPRIAQLRETYKDDREKLNRATMELYQKEKINPLSGCLPMLIQMPIFFAFYYVLRDSVELRQAPFGMWIHDLSSRDPYYILPLLMMGAMWFQYKINPQMGDAAQQKVMMIMPLVMSATFAFFPAGLVLYYVVNTVLSILQQWNINRRIDAQAAAARR